jgi:uracil-DNA glycosylase family 4
LAAKKKPVISPLDPAPFKLKDCEACACRKEARVPLQGRGTTDAKLLIVGQNPSGEEDQVGRAFIGRSWEELSSWLAILGVTEFWLTYAVKCHTEKNRPPNVRETKMCRDLWLAREVIKLPNLKAIISLGKTAKVAMLGNNKEENKVPLSEASQAMVADALGRQIPVFPIPHPSYFFRAPEDLPYHKQVVLPELRSALRTLEVVA